MGYLLHVAKMYSFNLVCVFCRIQEMVSRCAYIWIDTMTANYQRYIKAGLDMLTPKLEEKKEHLRGI